MATRNPQTTDAPLAEPRLPTEWEPHWPALDTDHDPEYLVTNDPVETDATTLADFGGIDPTDPERLEIPIDTRDRTRQTSVFAFPRKWWRDADRLEALFCERDLSMREISDLLGDVVGYEVVRTNLEDYGIRTPDKDGSMASRLAATDPEDLGLSPQQSDDSHAKFTKRGRSA